MKKMKIWLPVMLICTLFISACTKPAEENVDPVVQPGIEALGNYSENLIDLTKLTGEAVFTDVEVEKVTAMRGMGVDDVNQEFYVAQSNGTLPSDMMITKVALKDGVWKETERMHAYESGYGYICFETGSDGKPYLWMESNGSNLDLGTTLSYVQWQDDTLIQREYGQTFEFSELDGSLSAQVDLENDWLVVRVSNSKTGAYYAFYDRSALLAGEKAECLYTVSCEAGQKATGGKDDSKGRYGTITFRGFAVGGGYIYQLHGNAQGRIYVAAFDLEGTLIYCHEVKELSELTYREPDALSLVNGKLYLLLTSGEDEDRLASVMTFK